MSMGDKLFWKFGVEQEFFHGKCTRIMLFNYPAFNIKGSIVKTKTANGSCGPNTCIVFNIIMEIDWHKQNYHN